MKRWLEFKLLGMFLWLVSKLEDKRASVRDADRHPRNRKCEGCGFRGRDWHADGCTEKDL